MAMSPLPPFEITVKSGRLAVRHALQRLLDRLGPLELELEEASTVELVLAEALNNIVEHAYGAQRGAGPICIRCTHKTDGLHLRILDQGSIMPDGPLPKVANATPTTLRCDLPEGGFGWFMIQDLAKDVTYARIGAENRLDLRLAVALHTSPQPGEQRRP